MIKAPDNSVQSLLGRYPPEIRRLARKARDYVREVLPPGLEEIVDPSTSVIGYGYGTGYKDLICTLLISKSGVKLGIVRGASLEDKHRLLEGSGKAHRYVQLRSESDLKRPGVREILKGAHAAWKARQ